MASPTLATPQADATLSEQQLYAADLYANFADADGLDALAFSIASGLPAGTGLSIHPLTGVLSGTPTQADIDAEPLTVTVRCEDTASNFNTIELTLSGAQLGARTVEFTGDFETGQIQPDDEQVDGFLVQTLPEPQSGSASTTVSGGGLGVASATDARVTTGETPPSNATNGSANAVLPRLGSHCFRMLLDKDKDYTELNGSADDKPRNHLNIADAANRIPYDEEYFIGWSVFLPSNFEVDTGGERTMLLQTHTKSNSVFCTLEIWQNINDPGHNGDGDFWMFKHRNSDSSIIDTTGDETWFPCGSVLPDFDKWTDFVLHVRWNPHTGAGGPTNPAQAISGALNRNFDHDVGILQFYKTVGAVDGNGDRAFAQVGPNIVNGSTGLVARADSEVRMNHRIYKPNWKEGGGAVLGPIVTYSDEFRHGGVSTGTTFRDVNPGRLPQP